MSETRPAEDSEPMEHEKRLLAAKRKVAQDSCPAKVAKKSVPDLFAQRLKEKGYCEVSE